MRRINFLVISSLMCVIAILPTSARPQSASPNSSSESGEEVLKSARNVYRNLQTYEFDRTTTVIESHDGGKPKQVAEIKFTTATAGAVASPESGPLLSVNLARCRLGMEIDGHKFVLANSDDVSWLYSSRENVCKKRDGRSVLKSVPLTMLLTLHGFPIEAIRDGVAPDARVIREESLEVDKKQRSCFVIEGHVKNIDIRDLALAAAKEAVKSGTKLVLPEIPKFLGVDVMLTLLHTQGYLGEGNRLTSYRLQAKDTKLTLWIDKSDHLLVRSEMTTTLRKATINKDKPLEPKEEEVLVTLTDSFTRLKFNEKLPKELFQFTPPVGAKEEHERDE